MITTMLIRTTANIFDTYFLDFIMGNKPFHAGWTIGR